MDTYLRLYIKNATSPFALHFFHSMEAGSVEIARELGAFDERAFLFER